MNVFCVDVSCIYSYRFSSERDNKNDRGIEICSRKVKGSEPIDDVVNPSYSPCYLPEYSFIDLEISRETCFMLRSNYLSLITVGTLTSFSDR